MMHTDLMRFEDIVLAANFFAPGDVTLARAPGRLDVMGGIADYSGSLVAEMPIAAVCCVAAQRTTEATIVVRTADAAENGLDAEVAFPLDVCKSVASLQAYLRSLPKPQKWAGYLAGAVLFATDAGYTPQGQGWKLFVSSHVPVGAGVSSSAAVEVATMRAICGAAGADMEPMTMARLCQRVENDLLDAPCGIMDQVTCVAGIKDALLRLECQPHTIEGTSRLPEDWAVFGIDSGVKHSVSGHGYTEARVGAFMGLRMISERAGESFNNYLCRCNIDWYRSFTAADPLPERMLGADFLARYGGIADTVTKVNPDVTYRVRAASEHPIYEDRRVRSFIDCVEDGSDEAFRAAGAYMIDAHVSYSACGLGTPETDLLVDLAMEHAITGHVAGAKITGGGSGGTVCVLVQRKFARALPAEIARLYAEQTGKKPRIITGSSDGAIHTPTATITVTA